MLYTDRHNIAVRRLDPGDTVYYIQALVYTTLFIGQYTRIQRISIVLDTNKPRETNVYVARPKI